MKIYNQPNRLLKIFNQPYQNQNKTMKNQTDFETELNQLSELELAALINALMDKLDRDNLEHLYTPILKEYTFIDKAVKIIHPS